MRVLVLYETRRGFTLTVGRAIRDELRRRGHDATAAAVRTVDAGTLAAAGALIVGTWTTGKIVVGVGPAPGVLEGVAALPTLGGMPAAVYATYDVSPRGTLQTLAGALVQRGVTVQVGERFRNGPFDRTKRASLAKVPAFVDAVLASFERIAASATGATGATG